MTLDVDAWNAWKKLRRGKIENYLRWREEIVTAKYDIERQVALDFKASARDGALFCGRVVRMGKAMQEMEA